jgi:hypothetical protein
VALADIPLIDVLGTERLAFAALVSNDDFSTNPTASGYTAGTVVESTTGTDGGQCSFRQDNVSADIALTNMAGTAPSVGGSAVFAFAFKPPAPVYEQKAFRFRNDDGSESTATWKAAQNTDVSLAPGDPFRLRFLIQNDGETPSSDENFILYHRVNGGSWLSIGGTAATDRTVRYRDSANVAQDGATTEQMGGSGTFEAGLIRETGAGATGVTLDGTNETEFEWSLEVYGPMVSAGDTIDLRLQRTGSNVPFDTYTVADATITVAGGVTSVNKTLTAQYQVVGRINRTRTLQYGVTGKASQTRALQYAVAARVAQTRALQATIIARVTNTRILQYALAARAAQTRVLQAQVKSIVANTRALQAQVKVIASNTRVLQSQVFARVSQTRGLQYLMSGKVSATRVLQSTLRQIASGSRELQATIRTAASQTRTILNVLLNSVSRTRALQAQVHAKAERTRTLQYGIAGKVTQTRELRAVINARVDQTRTIQYTVIQVGKVSQTRTLQYVVNQRASQTRALQAQVKVTAHSSKELRYVVNQRTSETRTIQYALNQKASQTRLLQSQVLSRSSQTRVLQAIVHERATQTRELRYELQARVQQTREIRYGIEQVGRVSSSRQFQYTIRNSAGNILVVQWDNRNDPPATGSIVGHARQGSLRGSTSSGRLRGKAVSAGLTAGTVITHGE